MILFTPCKINIGLNILSRRPDGYHDISTLMVPIDWCDILEIVPSKSDKTTLTVLGHNLDCAPADNLVMKSYNKLNEAVGMKLPPVDIYLQKIIPDGAGLGGGSSDASHTLLALNQMFELGFSLEKLAEIASTLGADCPLFIYDRPMHATGTGTILKPVNIDLSQYTILLVKPPVHISTAQAYGAVSPRPWDTPLEEMFDDIIKAQPVNDFELGIFSKFPSLLDIKNKILNGGAMYASMSGSGSTIYGIFKNEADAIKCSKNLENEGIIHICHPI